MHTESAVVQPTAERMQHDPVGFYKQTEIDPKTLEIRETGQINDSRGGIGAPFSVMGILPQLVERKEITAGQLQAAFQFMDDFDTGHMHPLRASQFEIRGKGREELSNRVVAARNRVWRARKEMGMGSPVERAIWHVLGMRHSFSAWCEYEGHRFTERTAKKIFISALAILAHIYGCENFSNRLIPVQYQRVGKIRRGRQRAESLAHVA